MLLLKTGLSFSLCTEQAAMRSGLCFRFCTEQAALKIGLSFSFAQNSLLWEPVFVSDFAQNYYESWSLFQSLLRTSCYEHWSLFLRFCTEIAFMRTGLCYQFLHRTNYFENCFSFCTEQTTTSTGVFQCWPRTSWWCATMRTGRSTAATGPSSRSRSTWSTARTWSTPSPSCPATGWPRWSGTRCWTTLTACMSTSRWLIITTRWWRFTQWKLYELTALYNIADTCHHHKYQ